jgi:methionine aminopeptidase
MQKSVQSAKENTLCKHCRECMETGQNRAKPGKNRAEPGRYDF